MKLSDAPTTQGEIAINATAERVWQIVSDLQTPAQTSPEFGGATWLDGVSAPAVGARFVGRNKHEAIGEWETTSHVIVADAPREFAYAVGNVDSPGAVWRYQIEPTDVGVLLRQIAQIGPGRSGISYAIDKWPDKEERILQRRLAEHHSSIVANLAKIKELAESAGE